MIEIKIENGKSNVCRDDNQPSFSGVSSSSFLGLTRESSNAHNERGRSMVEMLGVLAVMGVLSIGGVAGYRYAIDKMNANDIINEVRKRAVTASQQRILGHDINLSEYGDNGRIKGLYDVAVTNDYTGDEGFFALTVSAVPQRVCDEILKQDWAMPVETAVGGVVVDDDAACCLRLRIHWIIPAYRGQGEKMITNPNLNRAERASIDCRQGSVSQIHIRNVRMESFIVDTRVPVRFVRRREVLLKIVQL